MDAATAPPLTAADVTLTTDRIGRLVAVIPDAVARFLSAAAHQGVHREFEDFSQSDPHPADGLVAATVRTVFDAVLAAHPEHDDVQAGLSQYRAQGAGTFYGFIVGESGWDAELQWWHSYARTAHLRVRGYATITYPSHRHAGAAIF